MSEAYLNFIEIFQILHKILAVKDPSGYTCTHNIQQRLITHFIFKVSKSCKIAKLRRAYPCGNVKSDCNFVSHNGESTEIT